jgi:hypothetical protein
MRFDKVQITHKDESQTDGTIAVPETLQELLKVYPEDRVYKLGLAEYMNKARKRLISTRSPILRFRLKDLTLEQQAALRKMGLLTVG